MLYFLGGDGMSKKELLLSELEHIPESLLDEALGFVRFLKSKDKQGKIGYGHCKRNLS